MQNSDKRNYATSESSHVVYRATLNCRLLFFPKFLSLLKDVTIVTVTILN